MMKYFICTLACVGAVFFFGCAGKKDQVENNETQAAISVRVLALEPGPFVDYGEYYGKTAGVHEATLISYTGGRVTRISAKPGSWVKKGQHLARIDADKAETQYETAVLNEKIAQDNYDRTKTHFDAGNASQLQLNQQKLALMNAKSARIEAERMREGALCIAPFGGIVTDRYIERYQEVAPGSPTFALAGLSKIRVTVYVPEGDIFSVDSDDEAKVYISAVDSAQSWPAKIISVAKSAEPSSQKYKVQLQIDNKDKNVNPGLTAKVRIALQDLDSQIVVPTGAVITSGIQQFVFVTEEGKAVKRLVEIAESNETHTRIIEGLSTGDKLVVAGQQRIKHNTPITIEN
ncbi:MAG: efflux RND transporter periplasmic adaptor subunit [Chitinivibrionales bacterium]|nr:efflux RND transporter periplasmic adaptor subunit [Chitinivibrionales bacterium]